jgi:hypothetical protein
VTAVRKLQASAKAELTPVYGTLLVLSTPFGADVRLDGEVAGATPMKRTELLGGSHRIEVRKHGYRPETRDVDVEGEKTNKVEVKLVELLGEELAAERMAAWEAKTAPVRSKAVTRTWMGVGAAGLAVFSGLQWQTQVATRDSALADYRSATSDADAKYAAYDDAWRQSLAWGAGAGVAAAAAAWFGWSAVSAWGEVPAKPVFEVVPGKAAVGVQGEW